MPCCLWVSACIKLCSRWMGNWVAELCIPCRLCAAEFCGFGVTAVFGVGRIPPDRCYIYEYGLWCTERRVRVADESVLSEICFISACHHQLCAPKRFDRTLTQTRIFQKTTIKYWRKHTHTHKRPPRVYMLHAKFNANLVWCLMCNSLLVNASSTYAIMQRPRMAIVWSKLEFANIVRCSVWRVACFIFG